MTSARTLIFLLILTLYIPACQLRRAVVLPPSPHGKAPIRDRYVMLINFDGSRPQELYTYAESGILPNIQKIFFQNGAVFENAITVYPTVSLPAHQSFVSGLFPGHHGIPALDWYSRPLKKHMDYLAPKDMAYPNVLLFNSLQLLENRVITDQPQLIYHDLTGYPTLAILEPTSDGVQTYLPKFPPVLAAWDFRYLQNYEKVDFKASKILLDYLKETPTDQLPRFSFINFYGIDNTSHFNGPASERSKDLYIHYDRIIGKIIATLRKKGIWDKTTLILVSDHGNHLLSKIVSLPPLLRKVGLEVNLTQPEKGQVVWGNHGTGTSNLYIKDGQDWRRRPSYRELRNFPLSDGRHIDLVESFLAQPEIEMVFVPEGPWVTHIFTDRGHARIRRKRKQGSFLFAYQPDPGADPLGYLDNPTILKWVKQKQFQDAESWLKETATEELPDAVVGLSQIFDDYRTGDLIIQTPKEYQFKEVKLAGHGSLDRTDRRVDLMFHGPDIKPGRYPAARSVDVYPTLLALYGLKTTRPIDGVTRKEILNDELNSDRLIAWGPKPNGKGILSSREFYEYLLTKSKDKNLPPLEREKSVQLLYDLSQFLARWTSSKKFSTLRPCQSSCE